MSALPHSFIASANAPTTTCHSKGRVGITEKVSAFIPFVVDMVDLIWQTPGTIGLVNQDSSLVVNLGNIRS